MYKSTSLSIWTVAFQIELCAFLCFILYWEIFLVFFVDITMGKMTFKAIWALFIHVPKFTNLMTLLNII